MAIYNRHLQGASAEHFACDYLQAKGLTLVQRNYKTPRGEIDLIMQDRNCLVFVEVRFRQRSAYGSALESITLHKMKKVFKAAQFFLLEKRLVNKISSRFDIITLQNEISEASLAWIKNAYMPEKFI